MAHGLSGFAGGAVAAAELWCEYAVDPLGVDVAEPRFSWILGSERRGQVQSACRILVASSADLLRGGVGDKWDSGVVASDASVNVPYAGAALASGERCFWQVRVWDGAGAGSAWSDPARFEMGLLDRGDWGGSWIGAEGDAADLAAPLLRKEFTIEEPVGEARLYLCGLGLYELSINGARVGDQVLDPALTDYRERVPYVAHDVTRCLRRGRNVIELLGRIHRNVTWTMRNALKGFPMDCLHREPLGYNEPASVSSLLYTRRHMPLFWSKWLDDIKAARRPDGSLSDWAPELPGSGREHDAAQAGNYPPLVWYLYQYYGDERILAEHYPAMRAYVDYLGTIAENGLITTGWLGDHMLPGPAPGWEEYVAEETPPPLIWTGYYYRGTLVVARAAEVLGRSADAARYGALAEAIRASFNAAYFDPASANYAAGSQTANGFALALDIVPDGRGGDLFGNLRREIMETHGGHIHAGHCGTTSVIEALAGHGGAESADTLFALATATSYPGWGYMVAQGATTIWECWGQDWAPGHKPRATSHRADSMMMWGCIGKFFYHCLAGIDEPAFHGQDTMAPGFREFRIAPHVAGDVTWVRASIKTVRGTVASSWQLTADSLAVQVEIPVNSRATVSIPKRGRHNVTVREHGEAFFRNGELAGTVPGLLGGRENTERVELCVGSGSYSFTLTGG